MRRLTTLVIAMLSASFLFFSCVKDPDGGETVDTSAFNKTSAWSIVGPVAGGWDQDIVMKTDGNWHAAFNVDVAANSEFKFRKNKSWDSNFGASSVTVGEKISLIPGGDNIKLPAGKYDMYIAETTQTGYILKAGSKFTHASDATVQEGGKLEGEYTSLAPSAKKSSLTYQLNVYSFADSDGDGWGDFQGIIDHLDYLDAIGATGLWLSPVQKSQSYHAYDITDYYTINPKYGGKNATAAQAEAKFKELITKAKERNIEIYLDYVLNHSGDQNDWFVKAKSGNATYRQYYVFSDNPTEDTKNKKVDNFAGQTDYHMGGWHSAVNGNPAYTGSKNLHYKLDVTTASAPKLTVTETDEAAKDGDDATWYIFDNNVHKMTKTSDKIYEVTLKFPSGNNWGVLVKDHASEWGDHKWGAPADDPKITFGTAKKLVKGDAANNIIFGGDVTYYFGSFDGSMPDLNYGPYTACAASPAFIDLAASADKWIKMGIGGLRLDAVMWIYQCNTDANVAFLSAWYDHCNATYKANGGKGDFFMVGEAYDYNASTVGGYYKGLPSCFDFAYYGTLKDRINRGSGSDFASTVAGFISQYQRGYDARKYTHSSGMIESPKLSNHDEDRVASDLGNHPQKKRLAGAVLLTSPGKPFVYQGEELGYWGVKSSGDENVRQPIYWQKGGTVPSSWCSFNKEILADGMSVEEQAADDSSLLQLYRHFAYARNTNSALAEGKMEPTSSGNGAVAAWYMTSSSQKVLVMHNFSASEATVSRSSDNLGNVIVSSVSSGEIKVSGSSVTIPAYSSVVFALK